jgi:hypothetical protein
MKKKPLTIIDKKLYHRDLMGRAHFDKNLIEMNINLNSRLYLETLIHELLHLKFPALSEKKVESACQFIAKGIWKQKFRRLRE